MHRRCKNDCKARRSHTDVGNIKEDSDINDLEKQIRQYIIHYLDNEFLSWVVEIGGKVVGISGLNIFKKPPALGNLSGYEGYIMNMYIAPEYRGNGFATLLMNEMINYMKQMDCNRIRLDASVKGKPIYTKLGFVEKDSVMELSW